MERIEDNDVETIWLGQTSGDAPPTQSLQMFGNMILTNLTQLMLTQEVDEAFRGFHSRNQMTNSYRVSNQPEHSNSRIEAQLYLWPEIREFLINRCWHIAVTLVSAYTLYLIVRFHWLPQMFQTRCQNCSTTPSRCAGNQPTFIFNGKPCFYTGENNSEFPDSIEMRSIPQPVPSGSVPTREHVHAKPANMPEVTDSSDDETRPLRRSRWTCPRPRWNFPRRECREREENL
ncbi:hypothetical protein Ddc_16741 [Ditylenchus destructor]|nr:hypothetical protein Ddc_16741 [Ditylenchus destructor]